MPNNMMNMNVANPSDALLEDLSEEMIIDQDGTELAEVPAAAPRRDLPAMMRKIPVTLTLEVGSARISLQDLMAIGPDSVVELVVLAGENDGLKVIDLDGLNLDLMTP